jgi:hypothetical protein
MHRARRAVGCRSFPTGDQHSLVEARSINRLTDSSECVEPPLTTRPVIEEVTHCLDDRFIGAVLSRPAGNRSGPANTGKNACAARQVE